MGYLSPYILIWKLKKTGSLSCERTPRQLSFFITFKHGCGILSADLCMAGCWQCQIHVWKEHYLSCVKVVKDKSQCTLVSSFLIWTIFEMFWSSNMKVNWCRYYKWVFPVHISLDTLKVVTCQIHIHWCFCHTSWSGKILQWACSVWSS